jgi:hypothetical protein
MMPVMEARCREELFQAPEGKARIGTDQDGLDSDPDDIGDISDIAVDCGFGEAQQVDRRSQSNRIDLREHRGEEKNDAHHQVIEDVVDEIESLFGARRFLIGFMRPDALDEHQDDHSDPKNVAQNLDLSETCRG